MAIESTTPITSDPVHVQFMRQALQIAKESVYIPRAFCVGCVLTSSSLHPTCPSLLLATGYSRELPGNTHAEQCALDKFLVISDKYSDEWKRELLEDANCYTTMEPCSTRMSGNVPCVERILQTGIGNVFIGVEEPKDFVECEGTKLLKERGVNVYLVVDPNDPTLGEQCLKVARGQQ
ncbi:uncharacterized protein JCM6883_004943 [Sporobolomyces salmoneus]|uniref:uncharacterized protein n=1 Tax=Sporobolomyces salmoneus TaxID=183962 RepID=UPI00316DF067